MRLSAVPIPLSLGLVGQSGALAVGGIAVARAKTKKGA
ncbi:hypothetical protein L489_4322 [Bordetella bronchiseptica 00-P-2730]|nr:hypothetical protein L489_4322 [Bordetella bronchiseptica 00-P-2730]